MKTCDESTAKNVGGSLLKHARAIHNYAMAYCRPTEENEYIDESSRAAFKANLARMLKEMDGLMLLANYRGVSRFCNKEQIEAYVECAREICETEAQVIDFEVLLN